MTTTSAWFLAADRIMAGPPMSMFSTASSAVTSGRATVASNGYRLTTTRSIGCYAVLRHYAVVGAAATENSAVYLRMQRLYTAIHHFRRAGMLRHFARGDARLRQREMGTPGRQNLDAPFRKRARQFDDSGFVGNAQQRPADRTQRVVCHGLNLPAGRTEGVSCATCRG